MKLVRCGLASLSLLALSLSSTAQVFTDEAIHQMAVNKTGILNTRLTLTEQQQNQAVAIIEKYDDPNTMNGTTPYAITESAEREILEILTPAQQETYKLNIESIRNSLRPAAAPAGTSPAKGKKKKSTK